MCIYLLTYWLCVIIMSQTSLRVTLHSVVAWVSRNSLFKTGAIYEIYVTAMGECFLHFSWLWVPIPLQSLCWYTLLDLNLLPNFFSNSCDNTNRFILRGLFIFNGFFKPNSSDLSAWVFSQLSLEFLSPCMTDIWNPSYEKNVKIIELLYIHMGNTRQIFNKINLIAISNVIKCFYWTN